jgi:ABC-2 type transport system ATP-binding protein/lipopolysaccharide transport system ATP-binding protein
VTTAPPAIEIRDVTKKFKLHADRSTSLKEMLTSRRKRSRAQDFWALRGVGFDIPKGSTFGLIGHNGSGKSTLLKLVAGIHRPTSGSITHNGRISAMLELGAGFHPELSGRENVYLNGAILGMTRRQIAAAMDDIIEFSGLAEFIDSPVKVYSSGMYVRLGFAIAVNLDPEILIIDEVIAVGDEDFQRRCFDHLATLKRRGITIVLVSHSLSLVQTLCDEVAWLDHGRLRAVGPAPEVTQEYLSEVGEVERQRDAAAKGVTAEAGHRLGSHEIDITKIEFISGEEISQKRAVAGEPLKIRVHYEAHEPVVDPVVGIAIYTENKIHITGSNSRMGGLRLGEVSGTGYVEWDMGRLSLNPGTFLVRAGMNDWSMAHTYDYWEDGPELVVRPGSAAMYRGIVALPNDWGFARGADPQPMAAMGATPLDAGAAVSTSSRDRGV